MSVSQQKMLRDNNKRGGYVKLGFDGKLHAASRVSVGGRYRKERERESFYLEEDLI